MFIERQRKDAQNIRSQDLVHEKTFWLSSHTPLGNLLKFCLGLNDLVKSWYK